MLEKYVRILLVRDPDQSMPAGPGLALHSVVEVPQVPTVDATIVKRHGNPIGAVASGGWNRCLAAGCARAAAPDGYAQTMTIEVTK